MSGPTVGPKSASTHKVDPLSALVQRQAVVNQTDENSGRYARYEAVCTSTGSGHFLQPDAVIFEAAFVQRPQVTYGHYVDGAQLVTKTLPTISGGVYKWVQDAHGFYMGAQVYYVVLAAGTGDVTVDHHFTFAGTAIKDVPADLLDV